MQFALAGQGLAVIPHYDAQQSLSNGKLIEVMQDYMLPDLQVFAVFPQGATKARATQLMLDMLRQYPPNKLHLLMNKQT